MGLSFRDVIESKTTRIFWFMVALFSCYEFTACSLLYVISYYTRYQVSVLDVVKVTAVAVLFAIVHWLTARRSGSDLVFAQLGAIPADPEDAYHAKFRRITEELSIAAGITGVACAVIPIRAMNAFALDDGEGTLTVGVTEGMLGRLNRQQLTAVVAHEIAHLVNGDAMLKTVGASLFAVVLGAEKTVAQLTGRRAPAVVIVLRCVLFVSKMMMGFLVMGLSRAGEWRADAAAVSYCRDPRALAEALNIAAHAWRGGGDIYDNHEHLFIIPPTSLNNKSANSFFDVLFETHPPIAERIARLLAMANAGEQSLPVPVQPDEKVLPVSRIESGRPILWSVFENGVWSLPAVAAQIASKQLFSDAFVRREGSANVVTIADEPALMAAFRVLRLGGQVKGQGLCPRCLIPLTTGQYEGVSLRCCTQCGGVLADRAVISRLTSRKEGAFPLEVVDAAKKVIADAQKVRAPGVTRFAHDLSCPLCGERMLTSFYSHDYRIEIDSCGECKVTWFDKNELQIVEYIAEFSDQVMEEIL